MPRIHRVLVLHEKEGKINGQVFLVVYGKGLKYVLLRTKVHRVC